MKALAIIFLALVGTLVLNGPIQSYADPQLDALLRITTQARENLKMNISQINNVPDEITNLFKQGSNETDALSNAIDKKDVVSARQHFLSAMNFFKTTNDKINSLNSTQVNDQQQTNVMQLQSEITRLGKIGETLKTIAITNHASFDFTQFDQLIQKAKQDLDNGNINETSKSIEEANHIIIDAHHSLTEIAKQRISDRAKDFTEKQIERFDKIRDLNTTQNVTMSISNTAITTTISNLTSAENPGEMISKLRKLVSEGNIDEALKVIKSLDAYQKRALRNNENQTESPLQTSVNMQNNTETNPALPSTNPSNVTVTNPPINNKLNTTTNNHNKINSEHDENLGQLSKVEKTNSFHSNNFNLQSKNNKTESQVIPQGSFDSTQQDKTHENKSHEQILEKQKRDKQNHN